MQHIAYCLFVILGCTIQAHAIPPSHYAHVSRRFHTETPSVTSASAFLDPHVPVDVLSTRTVKRALTSQGMTGSSEPDATTSSSQEGLPVGTENNEDSTNPLSHSDPASVNRSPTSPVPATSSLIQPASLLLPALVPGALPAQPAPVSQAKTTRTISKTRKGVKRIVTKKGKKGTGTASTTGGKRIRKKMTKSKNQ